MEHRVIRNRLAFGKPYRLQFGQWIYPSRLHDGSPHKRFIVDYEEDCQTREEAEARAAVGQTRRSA